MQNYLHLDKHQVILAIKGAGYLSDRRALGSVQEARNSMNRSVIHSWLEGRLLQHSADGRVDFAGISPYIALMDDPDDLSQKIWVPSYIHKKDMLQYPMISYTRTPLLMRTLEEAQAAVRLIVRHCSAGDPAARLVGLDLEWRPQFQAGMPQNPPAVLQVSCLPLS